MYITHKREDGTYQLLSRHINGVADRAAVFAEFFSGQEHARRIGLLHDIGKYSEAAQARQRDPENTSPVDHSTAGVQEAFRIKDIHAAFCVSGHHGGLPNRGSSASMEDGTLMARSAKKLTGVMDASRWRDEIRTDSHSLIPAWMKTVPAAAQGFVHAMYTRMLFSCLVDADYLDTEAYMSYDCVRRGSAQTAEQLLEKLESYVRPWTEHASSVLNRKRNDILERCLRGMEDEPGLYTLTIPTGGGKTVSSLAFALSHAAKHGLRRVIYVVPYTSIIEQNAQVFRHILGEENVLEHHANAEYDAENEQVSRLAAENWDAPVIVTTAVQFFESLFSSRTSRCRKLHNIASSVVIFDEAQMLPMPYLRPCVNAIAELVQHYQITAVLCTATQPSLSGLIKQYAPDLPCKEIAQDVEELYTFFRRVCFRLEGEIDVDRLAGRLAEQEQALCIVNSRKRAQEIYHLLPEEGRFHLSTLMTPEHRSRILAKIRQRLAQGERCVVVSTSLIEAGVDVDFPVVWREEAGLDSILQAAGRCNREGKRSAQDSIVYVFRFEGKAPRMFEQNIAALKKVVDQHEDIASVQAIRAYFNHLMFMKGDAFLDQKNIVDLSRQLAFRDIDREFKIIDTQTIPVYIQTNENQYDLDEMRLGRVTRSILRRLGGTAVNVYPQHFARLKEAGVLECPAGNEYGILLDNQQYDEACGLALEPECGNLWFC